MTRRPDTTCERIGKEQRAIVKPFLDENRRLFGESDGRSIVGNLCWEDAKGAWAIVIESLTVQPGVFQRIPMPYQGQPSATATYAVVRVDAAGKRTKTAPMPLSWPPSPGIAFDADGDGVAELAYPKGAEGNYATLAIWTLGKDGSVVTYAPADGIGARAVADIDGDGRMDLLYTDPFSGVIQTFSLMDVSSMAPPDGGGYWLMAHGKPDGTFSRDDDAARAYAKGACSDGELPKPAKDEAIEQRSMELAMGIRCARLWGKDTKTMEAAIKRHCRGQKKNQCPNEELFRSWARATPPLLLK